MRSLDSRVRRARPPVRLRRFVLPTDITLVRCRRGGWRANLISSYRATQLARDDREQRMVAREGLEPSKPLGRQIYSLLRLTASLPRQLAVYLEILVVSVYLRLAKPSTELAKGFEPPTC